MSLGSLLFCLKCFEFGMLCFEFKMGFFQPTVKQLFHLQNWCFNYLKSVSLPPLKTAKNYKIAHFEHEYLFHDQNNCFKFEGRYYEFKKVLILKVSYTDTTTFFKRQVKKDVLFYIFI